MFSYVDDTACRISWWNLGRGELGLKKINHWLETNSLTFNVPKTSYVQYTFAKSKLLQRTLKVHYAKPLTTLASNICHYLKKTIRYFEVVLDANRNWRPHAEQITSRVGKIIWLSNRLHQVDLHRLVFVSLALSLIGYYILI